MFFHLILEFIKTFTFIQFVPISISSAPHVVHWQPRQLNNKQKLGLRGRYIHKIIKSRLIPYKHIHQLEMIWFLFISKLYMVYILLPLSRRAA